MADGKLEVTKPVVYLVDDDPGVRGALSFALELEGFAVAAFANGGECLARPELADFGCLVVDFNLPDMTGLELIDVLRSRDVRMPAILVTSHPSRRLRQRAAAAGLPIVEKPLLGEQLLEAIRNSIAAEERRLH